MTNQSFSIQDILCKARMLYAQQRGQVYAFHYRTYMLHTHLADKHLIASHMTTFTVIPYHCGGQNLIEPSHYLVALVHPPVRLACA